MIIMPMMIPELAVLKGLAFKSPELLGTAGASRFLSPHNSSNKVW